MLADQKSKYFQSIHIHKFVLWIYSFTYSMELIDVNSLIPFILIVQTCGFQKNTPKIIKEKDVAPEPNMSNTESVKAEDNPPNDKPDIEKVDDDQKRKMVEKGLLQSKQIKENPLAKNLMIGKRGRPPTKQHN